MTKYTFLQRLSATIQFVLGFIFGVTLIAGVAVGAGYVYYKKMSVLPPKPLFSEEKNSTASKTVEPPPKTEKTTTDEQQISEIEPESPAEVDSELPLNAYKAQVTWPQGLSLRSEPTSNAGRIGGIAYNSTIIILEDTPDNKWQRVRIPWSGQEGWVKGGNTKRISY